MLLASLLAVAGRSQGRSSVRPFSEDWERKSEIVFRANCFIRTSSIFRTREDSESLSASDMNNEITSFRSDADDDRGRPPRAGVVLGLATSAAVTRLMESMLFEVQATDPLVLGGVAFILVAVSSMAAYLPARRASRADPMVALNES